MQPAAGTCVRNLIALLVLSPLSSAFSVSSWIPRRSPTAHRGLNRRGENTTVIPAAIEIAPSQYWDGNDGPWSSFPLQVGTPAQNVRAFISTASSTIFTVGVKGCPDGYPSDCPDQRGFVFLANQSLTWIPNSIYDVGIERNLGLDINSDVGFDAVTLGWQGSGGPTVQHSTIFNMGTATYWLGSFGVNPLPTNFSNQNDPQPSYMTQLVNNNTIPSRSFGYTAGNQYRLNQVYGSLVLGGYDQNRFDPTQNVSVQMYPDVSRDLLVNIQGITTDKGSPSNLLPDGPITAYIDSTIAQLWLPESACEAFEAAFGLVYDDFYEFYLVNSSLHDTLKSLNPSVTFTIGSAASGGPTVDITLPYGAFDLQLMFPNIVNPNSSYYFPLKRAANNTQYTLGRTFLQEAYLIADYDHSNFTVAPCIWDQSKLSSSNIQSILRANVTGSVNNTGSSSDVGAIAGGVIGGLVGAILILGAILFWLHRRKKQKKALAATASGEKSGSHAADGSDAAMPFISPKGELSGGEIHELTAPHKPPAQEMPESPGPVDPKRHGYSEMEAREFYAASSTSLAKGVPAEMHGSTPIYEMPGSDVHEMPASDRRRKRAQP